MYSSNIGSVKIALDVGTEGPSSPALVFRSPGTRIARNWQADNAAPMAPDQHYDNQLYPVTPLHLAGAVSTVVNGGLRPDSARPSNRRSAALSAGIEGHASVAPVKSGTGRNADPGFLVGGKTGTAVRCWRLSPQGAAVVFYFPLARQNSFWSWSTNPKVSQRPAGGSPRPRSSASRAWRAYGSSN